MSERYVYSLKSIAFDLSQGTTDVFRGISKTPSSYFCNSYEISMDKQSKIAKFVPVNGTLVSEYTERMPTSRFQYIIHSEIVYDAFRNQQLRSSTLLSSQSGRWWKAGAPYSAEYYHLYVENLVADSSDAQRASFTRSVAVAKAGSSTYGYQSSASKNIQEGVIYVGNEARWVEFLGSDNIDPSAVTYSKSELQAGEQVGVSVTPRQPTYGGTVYYQFSYSVDGGKTWTNVGSKTTSLSVSIMIPSGVKQFQARAVASDGWGFTSATPVYGPSLGVSVLKAYVGVSNKAKAVSKIYIGIDGKSREVVKGYIGVKGKAKKFL